MNFHFAVESASAVLEPRLLRGAEVGARRVVDLGLARAGRRQRRGVAAAETRGLGDVRLRVAVLAVVDEEELGHVAPLDAAVELHRVAAVLADRHPVAVGLVAGDDLRAEGAERRAVEVVRHLVVVPHGRRADVRHQVAQRAVVAVLGVLQVVVGEHHGLAGAAAGVVGVDGVADVEEEIRVVARDALEDRERLEERVRVAGEREGGGRRRARERARCGCGRCGWCPCRS